MVLVLASNYYSTHAPNMSSQSDDRLRTPPRERLAADVKQISLSQEAAKLRAEPPRSASGHRQVALVRHGRLSVILFVFEDGGFIKDHSAPGEVTIHVLNGNLTVGTPDGDAILGGGEILVLAPGVKHSVHAPVATDMLLTISLV